MKNYTLSIIFCFTAFQLFAQFHWEHTDGPEGGRLSLIKSNGEYAFYTDDYFLYRTNDGIHWEGIPSGKDIWPTAVYESTLVGGRYNYILPSLAKFMVSHDNGTTWEEKSMPPGLLGFSDIAICSHGVYIPKGQDGIIYRSTDFGETWELLDAPGQFAYDIWAYEDRLYMNVGGQLLRSDTNGENWTPVFSSSVGSVLARGDSIVVVVGTTFSYSHDDGQTWDSHQIESTNSRKDFVLIGDKLFGNLGKTLLISDDFGINITEIPYEEPYTYPYYIAKGGDYPLLSTYNNGVIRYNETSQQFELANKGLNSAAVYDLEASGEKIWAGTGTTVSFYDKQTQMWTEVTDLPLAEHHYNNIATGANGLVAVSAIFENDKFYLSTNNGETWENIIVEPDPWGGVTPDNLELFDSTIIVYSDIDGWYGSKDLGITWDYLDIPISYYGNMVEFDGKLIGAGYNGIYSSADSGYSWTLLSEPTPKIDYIFAAGNRLLGYGYITTGNWTKGRFYTSTDGIDWKYAHDGLGEVDGIGLGNGEEPQSAFYEHEGVYYLNIENFGIYASTDNLTTWLPVEERKFHHVLLDEETFYAGGFGGGVIHSGVPKIYGELVSGIVFKDDNNDGIQNMNEIAIPNVKVGLKKPWQWSPYYFTTTQDDGEYVLGILPNDTDTLRPQIHHNYIENISPPLYPINTGGMNLDFGIHFTENITDVSVKGHYMGRPRPGFDLGLGVRYKNEGTLDADAKISITLDSKFSYLNADPPPAEIIGDSLVWNADDLQLFSEDFIRVYMNLPPTAELGDKVTTTCQIIPTEQDANLDDNFLILCDTIVGSYDPNNKLVTPKEGLTAQEIAEGKELIYTVNFQNTGTWPAEIVRITDQIDTALNLETLRLMTSSHEITSWSVRPGGLLEVVFDNINLPDSLSNEPESHGFVTYAIQRNKHFNEIRLVRNTAAIYFDFNEPIFTNEVSFSVPSPIVSTSEVPKKAEESLLIFPNPAQTEFAVSTNGKMWGEGRLEIFDGSGKKVNELLVSNLNQLIWIKESDFTNGVYFIRISNRDRNLSGRVMVIK